MSETTSFLGGAALAGLAAVVLLKGGVAVSPPTVSPPPTLPPMPPYPSAPLPPTPTATPSPTAAHTGPTTEDLEKQRRETEQLRSLVEQQRIQSEQMKSQIQSQQALIDTLNAQARSNNWMQQQQQQQQQPKQTPQPSSGFDASNPVFTGLMWALGGIVLTLVGGGALVLIFALFARQQRPPSRTIEVIHDNYPPNPNYLPHPQRRRSQVLPPRRVIKRVNAEEID